MPPHADHYSLGRRLSIMASLSIEGNWDDFEAADDL